MSKEFEKTLLKLDRLFGKDRNMALATSVGDVPTVRIIDAFYAHQSLYIVTHESSDKVRQITANKYVSLGTGPNEFQGEAVNIGHPLNEANKQIRDLLTDAFSAWYFAHNDEADPGMCYVQVKLRSASVLIGKSRYIIDFEAEEVSRRPA